MACHSDKWEGKADAAYSGRIDGNGQGVPEPVHTELAKYSRNVADNAASVVKQIT